MSEAGRNDPCPCGSGKKYKRCCWPAGGVGVRYTRRDREQALAALEVFVDGPGWLEIQDEADDEFWQDVDPEETAIVDDELVALMSEQLFDWWLFFDYRYDGERRVVDAFLEVAENLSPGARAYLELAKATRLWAYQVTEVRPGQGMTLRDVVTGEEQRVVERSGSRGVHRWDVLATRIMPADKTGDPILDGGLVALSPMRSERIIEWLKELVSQPNAGALRFGEVVPQVHAAWITPFEMPALVNFDGDPMVFARVYFDVEDARRVTELLDGAEQLERVENPADSPRWSWSGTGKDRKEPVVWGWFSLTGARLVFETNSAERAERGRELVEGIAGDVVKYRVTRTEDALQAIAAATEGRSRAPGAQAGNPLPSALREGESAAVEQYMTEYYERWLDEPIPRLDGKTPREAARANDSRTVEMLKELEVMYEKALSSGQPAFDPSWMWEELGLSHHRDAPGFRQL